MAANIAIPKVGMAMKEATLLEWKVEEGAHVSKGDVVLVLQTEKVKVEVEAAADGYVRILVAPNVKAPVGRIVGLIAETEEELAALQKEPPQEMFTTAPVPAKAGAAPRGSAGAAPARAASEVIISPAARKLAQEQMIDVTTVVGTGPGGRIVREDIEEAMRARDQGGPMAVGEYAEKRVRERIPLVGMREAIAEHMHRSLSISAQLTMMGEIDMTQIVRLRTSLLQQEKSLGVRISYNDIFIVVCAKALLDNPIINSSLEGNEIVVWEDVNIGVAVAIEEGLIVPVIRNADKKSLVEIAKETTPLIERARTGSLMPDDVMDGTFTITNLGAVGSGWGFGTPIISQPQSAILGTGAISDRAVVRDGQVAVRPIMTYSFTFDHRVIDGAPAAKFMARVTQLLENPGLFIL
ncbi:MAG TPA: dihydrolipoamide acetyltransferase family protein [Dehalococcoidia bacterium]|nr:dihydrolipoamide acetyltransferase family protein [Dehalococcoidia bacterium]